MATDATFVAHVLDQLGGPPAVSARRMFGEYAVYHGHKVIALVCGNRLFVKPTAGARTLLPAAAEVPPYPGAKPHLAVDDALDDRDLMRRVAAQLSAEVPEPRPKPGPTTRGLRAVARRPVKR